MLPAYHTQQANDLSLQEAEFNFVEVCEAEVLTCSEGLCGSELVKEKGKDTI